MKYGVTNFARELLSAADNLRRAVDQRARGRRSTDEATKNLLAGVAATERELLAAFEKNGIRRIDPKGERFDHNFHQAIFEVENTGKPAGTIVEVLQPGYVLHDRLLRPAMVGVAKAAAPSRRAMTRSSTIGLRYQLRRHEPWLAAGAVCHSAAYGAEQHISAASRNAREDPASMDWINLPGG